MPDWPPEWPFKLRAENSRGFTRRAVSCRIVAPSLTSLECIITPRVAVYDGVTVLPGSGLDELLNAPVDADSSSNSSNTAAGPRRRSRRRNRRLVEVTEDAKLLAAATEAAVSALPGGVRQRLTVSCGGYRCLELSDDVTSIRVENLRFVNGAAEPSSGRRFLFNTKLTRINPPLWDPISILNTVSGTHADRATSVLANPLSNRKDAVWVAGVAESVPRSLTIGWNSSTPLSSGDSVRMRLPGGVLACSLIGNASLAVEGRNSGVQYVMSCDSTSGVYDDVELFVSGGTVSVAGDTVTLPPVFHISAAAWLGSGQRDLTDPGAASAPRAAHSSRGDASVRIGACYRTNDDGASTSGGDAEAGGDSSIGGLRTLVTPLRPIGWSLPLAATPLVTGLLTFHQHEAMTVAVQGAKVFSDRGPGQGREDIERLLLRLDHAAVPSLLDPIASLLRVHRVDIINNNTCYVYFSWSGKRSASGAGAKNGRSFKKVAAGSVVEISGRLAAAPWLGGTWTVLGLVHGLGNSAEGGVLAINQQENALNTDDHDSRFRYQDTGTMGTDALGSMLHPAPTVPASQSIDTIALHPNATVFQSFSIQAALRVKTSPAFAAGDTVRISASSASGGAFITGVVLDEPNHAHVVSESNSNSNANSTSLDTTGFTVAVNFRTSYGTSSKLELVQNTASRVHAALRLASNGTSALLPSIGHLLSQLAIGQFTATNDADPLRTYETVSLLRARTAVALDLTLALSVPVENGQNISLRLPGFSPGYSTRGPQDLDGDGMNDDPLNSWINNRSRATEMKLDPALAHIRVWIMAGDSYSNDETEPSNDAAAAQNLSGGCPIGTLFPSAAAAAAASNISARLSWNAALRALTFTVYVSPNTRAAAQEQEVRYRFCVPAGLGFTPPVGGVAWNDAHISLLATSSPLAGAASTRLTFVSPVLERRDGGLGTLDAAWSVEKFTYAHEAEMATRRADKLAAELSAEEETRKALEQQAEAARWCRMPVLPSDVGYYARNTVEATSVCKDSCGNNSVVRYVHADRNASTGLYDNATWLSLATLNAPPYNGKLYVLALCRPTDCPEDYEGSTSSILGRKPRPQPVFSLDFDNGEAVVRQRHSDVVDPTVGEIYSNASTAAENTRNGAYSLYAVPGPDICGQQTHAGDDSNSEVHAYQFPTRRTRNLTGINTVLGDCPRIHQASVANASKPFYGVPLFSGSSSGGDHEDSSPNAATTHGYTVEAWVRNQDIPAVEGEFRSVDDIQLMHKINLMCGTENPPRHHCGGCGCHAGVSTGWERLAVTRWTVPGTTTFPSTHVASRQISVTGEGMQHCVSYRWLDNHHYDWMPGGRCVWDTEHLCDSTCEMKYEFRGLDPYVEYAFEMWTYALHAGHWGRETQYRILANGALRGTKYRTWTRGTRREYMNYLTPENVFKPPLPDTPGYVIPMFRVRATADGVVVIKLETDTFQQDHISLNAIKIFRVKARPLNPIAQYNLFGASTPSDEHMCYRQVQRYELFPENTACGYNRDLSQWISCNIMDPTDFLKVTVRDANGNSNKSHAVRVPVSLFFRCFVYVSVGPDPRTMHCFDWDSGPAHGPLHQHTATTGLRNRGSVSHLSAAA